MFVVDSSAVIAIFRREEDAGDYARRIAADDDPMMSAANLVETTSFVLRGLKKIAPAKAERWLDDFMKAAGIRIEPVRRIKRKRLARLICNSARRPGTAPR